MPLFAKQAQHYIALMLLLLSTYGLVVVDDRFLAGQLFGVSTAAWLVLAIAVPIVHQIYVWLVWRLQLRGNSVQKALGENAFLLYAIGFTVLFVGRLISIILLALSNRNTLPLPASAAYFLAVILLIPSVYLFYSVRKYFGFKRAYGIDHFDDAYRTMPFVRKGIFRWTSNAMYTFGFFVLWIPGLLFLSNSAILVAAFNHIYIWVHYYCTERPDIEYLYADTN